ncbi:MAG: C45 family autoproteolytic acyltransferase/hydrolase [Acidobacteriota bacterium]|nr:C45 family autoproteolytic acyltransferase/hydrolase [Acidobacteriota bacterium]
MPRIAPWLLLALPLSAATTLFNGSFDGAAKDWTVERGIAFSDSSVAHNNHKALVVQPTAQASDALIRSAPVSLIIGKRYQLSGWVRTDELHVTDAGRSPIAVGAALSMASMPFDMHSESLGGTHDWTRLQLPFVATRARDQIVLSVGNSGSFNGKAWFEGVSIDEISSRDEWPARAAVQTFGPAYRYPTGGWIYLHIEGQPYERGYQHGHLMSKEIVTYLERCAADIDPRGKTASWDQARTTANALFLRGFDKEILQEMQGIADGASDAGAQWERRRIDLIDIVTANTTVELGELRSALPMTPTGLEGLHLMSPHYYDKMRDVPVTSRCSAFAATGKATRDGKMVIAHITMWPLTLAEQTNVMLDITPTSGHRVLMQSYPGGIESGTDWYQNDAGMVLSETTIRQSPFNSEGTPVAYRARKAIQYGENIDQVVEHLALKNNGLYTNEWLIADAKNDEVAMFELGTYKTRLYRSSKNDWFGGTEGFYWGCNNAKDLGVRLEYAPDPNGAPAHLPYVPASRDLKWQELYQQHKGKIDEQFAFLAFRTAPLVTSTSMDAKVATADLASRLMTWAVFGKPNQREWVPSSMQKQGYPGNEGIYSSGYRLISTQPSESLAASIRENEKLRLGGKPTPFAKAEPQKAKSYQDRLWKGWILPASEADNWLSAGSAAYYEDLESNHLDQAIAAHWAKYREATLNESRNPIESFQAAEHKGALFLDSLRRGMGDDRFFRLMTDFFAAHTTKPVSAATFLEKAGATFVLPRDPGGPLYTAGDIAGRLGSAIVVYGTVLDAGANRYAAEQLQRHYLNMFESALPILKDFELTEDDLRTHDVVFIGRSETNSALAAIAKRINLDSQGGMFNLAGQPHAQETEALLLAATNPLNRTRMILVMAGNNALATVLLANRGPGRRSINSEYTVFNAGEETASGFLPGVHSTNQPAFSQH